MSSRFLTSCYAQTRMPGELVRPHEVHFKLHEAEVPLKNKVQKFQLLQARSYCSGRWNLMNVLQSCTDDMLSAP